MKLAVKLVFLCALITIICFKEAEAQILPNTITSTSNTCITLSSELKHGSRDAGTKGQVSVLQGFLQANSYLPSDGKTGFFGDLTLGAVINFQTANNIIPASGIVGPLTRAKIYELSCSEASIIAGRAPHIESAGTPGAGPSNIVAGSRITLEGAHMLGRNKVHPQNGVTVNETQVFLDDKVLPRASISNNSIVSILPREISPGTHYIHASNSYGKSNIVEVKVVDGAPTEIKVSKPKRGEKWVEGKAYTIKWSKAKGTFDHYSVLLSNKLVPETKGGGPVFVPVPKKKTSISFDGRDLSQNMINSWLANSDGTVSEAELRKNFYFTVQAEKNIEDGKTKVVAYGEGAVFSIVPVATSSTGTGSGNSTTTVPVAASVTVTTPPAWVKNQNQTITISRTALVSPLYVYLTSENGISFKKYLGQSNSSSLSVSASTLGTVPAGNYRILVGTSLVGDQTGVFTKSGLFEVKDAAIVTPPVVPTGSLSLSSVSSVWMKDQSQSITFTRSNFTGTLYIYLYDEGEESYKKYLGQTNGSTFTIPASTLAIIPAGKYKILVGNSPEGYFSGVFARSAVFELKNAVITTPAPTTASVTVSTPSSAWVKNQNQTVTFSRTNIVSVLYVYLLSENEVSYRKYLGQSSGTSVNVPASFLSAVPAGNYKILVGSSLTGQQTGTFAKSGVFEVKEVPISAPVINSVPTVSSFSPTTARAGNTVLVTGSNFSSNASVYLGEYDLSVRYIDSTKIEVTIPTNATAGTRSFLVENNIGYSPVKYFTITN